MTYEQRTYTMHTQWLRFGERKPAILSLHCVRKHIVRPATLAFAGASSPQDQRDIDTVSASIASSTVPFSFAAAWLRHRGLPWASDLVPSYPSHSSTPQEHMP